MYNSYLFKKSYLYVRNDCLVAEEKNFRQGDAKSNFKFNLKL